MELRRFSRLVVVFTWTIIFLTPSSFAISSSKNSLASDAPRLSLQFGLAENAFFSLPPTAASGAMKCSPMAVVRTTALVDENVRTTLRGNLHRSARAEFDLGRVEDDMPLEHIIMVLRRSSEQETALVNHIDRMHNRRSADYHQWLTPQEFGGCYGPADLDIARVMAWLQSHGFKIDTVPAGKTIIIFSGTAGQVREAFQTEIHYLNVRGEQHISNMSEPTVPKALAPVIAGLQSLNNFFPKPLSHIAGPIQRDTKTGKWNFIELREGEAKQSQGSRTSLLTLSDGLLAVGPQDFYVIYNENPLLTAATPTNGAGQTLAIVQESDVNPADVTTFRSQFGLPTYPSTPNATQGGVNFMFGVTGSTTCTDPGILGPNNGGVESEADIDVQWMGTTAPAATIDFVACNSTNTTAGINLSLAYIVDNLASTVSAFSFSFGFCEADVDQAFGQPNSFYNSQYEQAVSEGQTPVVAAGDTGDDTCDRGDQKGPNKQDISVNGLSVSGLASTPYNVATGGTDFSDNYSTNFKPTAYWNSSDTSPYGSALSYIPEMAWDNTCGSTIIAAFVGGTPEQICNGSNANLGEGLTTLDGGSGGVSSIYSLPTWQSAYGVGLSTNLSSTANRNLPDISLFASDGGSPAGIVWAHLLVYCESDAATCDYTNANDTIAMAAGGTSFVAPMVAGILGLVNQAWPSGNPAQTTRQGQADYTLYALGTAEYGIPGTPNTSSTAPSIYTCEASNVNAITKYGTIMQGCIFNEINRTPQAGTTTCVDGTNDSTCLVATNDEPCEASTTNCYIATTGDTYGLLSASDSTFEAAYVESSGYNDANGLGSLNIANLVANWTAVTPQFPSTTTVSANPTSIYTTTTTTLTATVTASGRGGLAPPLGTVTFFSSRNCKSNLPPQTIGTAALVAGTNNASASLPGVTGTQLGAGSQNVIACFSGDGANDAPSSSSQAITVTQTAFTLTGPTSAVTATAGQQATVTLNLSANAAVPTTITLAQSGLPSDSSPSFSSVTSLPATVTLTFTPTTADAKLTPPARQRSSRMMLAFLLPGLLLPVAGARKRKKSLLGGLTVLMILLCLGCGGSGSSSGGGGGGSSSQSYNVTVTASANNVTQGTASFQVTVSK
jgi:hypothetical protein